MKIKITELSITLLILVSGIILMHIQRNVLLDEFDDISEQYKNYVTNLSEESKKIILINVRRETPRFYGNYESRMELDINDYIEYPISFDGNSAEFNEKYSYSLQDKINITHNMLHILKHRVEKGPFRSCNDC